MGAPTEAQEIILPRTGMKVRMEKPPVWKEAHVHFKIDDRRTVYTYGDTIFNPAGVMIDPALEAHEATHADQHAAFEGGAAAWWVKYFSDPKFRQEQELEAYQNQYAFYCMHVSRDRNSRARLLDGIAGDLASPMYGSVITKVEATQKIRGNTK